MKKLLFIILTIGLYSTVQAQFRLEFTYDVSGNQIERKYVGSTAKELNVIENKDDLESLETFVSNSDIADYITIYPNPTDGLLKLEWNPVIANQIQGITIVEFSGRSWQLTLPTAGKNSIEIDLRNNASGMYIIQFMLSEAGVITKKILKK